MKQIISILFLSTLLGCQPVKQLTVCRVFTEANVSHEKINMIVNNALVNTTLSGWTLYPAQGAWRNASNKPFTLESSVVIELFAETDISHETAALAQQLEKDLHQEKVFFYCTKA